MDCSIISLTSPHDKVYFGGWLRGVLIWRITNLQNHSIFKGRESNIYYIAGKYFGNLIFFEQTEETERNAYWLA